MIHSGAIVGAGVPQLRSMFFKWINLPYHYFRSDKEKRDFVSSGAAAGVAGTILHTLLQVETCIVLSYSVYIYVVLVAVYVIHSRSFCVHQHVVWHPSTVQYIPEPCNKWTP